MVKVTTLNLAHISVKGVVQGVGFRPFIYQLATKYNLRGWVRNTSGMSGLRWREGPKTLSNSCGGYAHRRHPYPI